MTFIKAESSISEKKIDFEQITSYSFSRTPCVFSQSKVGIHGTLTWLIDLRVQELENNPSLHRALPVDQNHYL
jgi:hypothetical protein